MENMLELFRSEKNEELCALLHIPGPVDITPESLKNFLIIYFDHGRKIPLHDYVLQRVFFFDVRGNITFNVRKTVFDEARKGLDHRYGYTSGYFSELTYEIDRRRFSELFADQPPALMRA